MPEVTIAILNYNGRHFLEQFLPFLFQTTYPHMQVWVIDNASTDDSVAWTTAHYPQVKLWVWEQNHGFTGGYNRIVPHIETPYFVLLNSDVEVTPGWIEPLVAAMEADPLLASVQPKILDWKSRDQFEYAGAAGGWLDSLGYPFCRGRVFDVRETDQGQYDTYQPVAWATGACSLVRTRVAKEHGLFQEDFFAHMEEIEFCWRVQAMGYHVACEPRSVVYHVGGGTLPQGNPRKTFLNVRNSLAMLWLHLPQGQRIGRVFLRMVLDGVWGLYALTKGDTSAIGAILKGHFAFYGRMGAYQQERNRLYQNRKPAWPAQGVLAGSVVWQHFVSGKKRWVQLFSKEK